MHGGHFRDARWILIGFVPVLCSSCLPYSFNYPGPPQGIPTADISLAVIEGERGYVVAFWLYEKPSKDNCNRKGVGLAFANVKKTEKWLQTNLSNLRIPADQEIEIKLQIDAHHLLAQDYSEEVRAGFTLQKGHSYRFQVEWGPKYLDVRLLDVSPGQRSRLLPIKIEMCESSLLPDWLRGSGGSDS